MMAENGKAADEALEPTLEFGDTETEALAQAPAAPTEDITAAARQEKALDDSILSDDDKRKVEEFVRQIDLTNSGAVLGYGVGSQKKMADFSEKTLESVRTKDLGEVGNSISSLVTQLKNFDVDDEGKGPLSFLHKQKNKLEIMKVKYDKVEANVTAISETLENHQVALLKDIDVLDRMYDLNEAHFKELTMYIMAGKEKLAQMREKDLPAAQAKAEKSGLATDAQAAKDLAAQLDRFEKRVYDLELTREVAIQTAPQIRLVQSSDAVMAEKIQSTLVNTIPLWKNQMVIAMGIEHTTQAAKAQREVTDMTNELLRKNADTLKTATIESARESERGIVDMETLQHTNESLISTLDEVAKIQAEGKEKRIAAEAQLSAMEDQLKSKLLEAAKG
jgi:uncharacterized protein YaaN involved in tellurite resistance